MKIVVITDEPMKKELLAQGCRRMSVEWQTDPEPVEGADCLY